VSGQAIVPPKPEIGAGRTGKSSVEHYDEPEIRVIAEAWPFVSLCRRSAVSGL
jgi:hypothetical protein